LQLLKLIAFIWIRLETIKGQVPAILWAIAVVDAERRGLLSPVPGCLSDFFFIQKRQLFIPPHKIAFHSSINGIGFDRAYLPENINNFSSADILGRLSFVFIDKAPGRCARALEKLDAGFYTKGQSPVDFQLNSRRTV